MKINKTKIYKTVIFIFFALLFIFRLNNALNYNSYWGYDGAKHMEYIDTIEDKHRLPTFGENYLAWHEPLYYFIFAILGFIYKFISGNNDFILMIKFLQIITACLDVVFLFIFYKTIGYLTKSKFVKLATLLSVGFFTPLIIVNNYLTNELFLFWLIILCFYFIVKFEMIGWNYSKIILLSILSALALLTKLSALIFISSLIIWFFYQAIYFKKNMYFKYLLLFIGIVFVLNLPWQIYRAKNFGGVLTINNYEFLQKNKLSKAKDIPDNFFFNFNFDIFKNPFWQTSRSSFWSIIFAQLLVDYDNIGGNVDLNNLRQEIMTGNGRYICNKIFSFAKFNLVLGIFFILTLLFGYFSEIIKIIKNKLYPDIYSFLVIFVTMSFLGLIYNVIKNPFIERGTLKIIFILSSWPWLFFLGYKNIDDILQNKKLKYWWIFIGLIIVVYSYVSLNINWVSNYQ
ncbi:hypothetical protein COX27_01395 [Candidatus Kuenenbacteria bacterium CG23_combo_of_CG06-09_8_20_14_all_36_9]|uniref:Glycosyltransferase RgtA/B/C/D-like domain-containing protein n=1 Tax=Candidatus Kuenenbacteria bacterium CG10_big_fil_rev_8_21_14_0_10_36_11 TaxID=1974618 RepID=A0A2M6WAA5_9BACT|nr:MAG: hypothetical protein COX27_01395 [Candidatus Kuenenbacteria bacterium CG23_combo_of_CG06-09_8_20_14_all_36_9]PIT89726.1 MAG: hypothetical protein COU23_02480 [Candidatus Kuenenbacteria bacterium CG10_big_fil_rev_8_21_14_0_10_36_11]